ncbi:MAG: hypothetical protein OXU20_24185 [Myxococcales bacterium]|nr:hypothetical protein [Myxococcales bacterium]
MRHFNQMTKTCIALATVLVSGASLAHAQQRGASQAATMGEIVSELVEGQFACEASLADTRAAVLAGLPGDQGALALSKTLISDDRFTPGDLIYGLGLLAFYDSEAAVDAIWRIYEQADRLVGRSLPPSAPAEVVELAEDFPEAMTPRFRADLEAPDPAPFVLLLKRAALRELGRMTHPNAERRLLLGLEDEEPRVQILAARGLSTRRGFPGKQRVKELAAAGPQVLRAAFGELLSSK